MKNALSKAAAVAALALAFGAAQAAPTVLSSGATAATIDDAGYFSPSGALGLSFMGREFVNLGTFGSNFSFNAGGVSLAVGDAVAINNPLTATAAPIAGGVQVTGSIGGWSIIQTYTIPTDGHVAVEVQLINNTGSEAREVQWGVGTDPDQGIPGGVGFGTTNVIDAQGSSASVTATSLDDWVLSLRNLSGYGVSATAYVDPFSCCTPVDPAAMLSAAQAVGNYGFADSSINLAYALGSIADGQSVTFGYEYVMASPAPVSEPGVIALMIAGLGLIGASARRRKQ